LGEINAAFGLLQLESIDEAIRKRRKIDSVYRDRLQDVTGLAMLQFPNHVLSNGSYFPVFVKSDALFSRDEIHSKLKDNNIYARKYFYPLITCMEPYKTDTKSIPSQALYVANELSSQVLCLPIYPDLSIENVHMICDHLCGWLTNE
jgi:dTDP-4-amino-4,6-dideoxygalactose transaminase